MSAPEIWDSKPKTISFRVGDEDTPALESLAPTQNAAAKIPPPPLSEEQIATQSLAGALTAGLSNGDTDKYPQSSGNKSGTLVCDGDEDEDEGEEEEDDDSADEGESEAEEEDLKQPDGDNQHHLNKQIVGYRTKDAAKKVSEYGQYLQFMEEPVASL